MIEGFQNALMTLAFSFRGVIDWIRKATYTLVKWNEDTDGAVSKVALLATAIGAATAAFGPIGFLGALAMVKQHWIDIEGWLGGPNSKGVQLFNNLGQGIIQAFAQIPSVLSFIFNSITDMILSEDFNEKFSGVFDTLFLFVKRAIRQLGDWIGDVMTMAVGKTLKAAGQAMGAEFDFIGQFLGSKIEALGEALIKRAKKATETSINQLRPVIQTANNLQNEIRSTGATRVVVDNSDVEDANKQTAAEVRSLHTSVGRILSLLGDIEYTERRKESRPRTTMLGELT